MWKLVAYMSVNWRIHRDNTRGDTKQIAELPAFFGLLIGLGIAVIVAIVGICYCCSEIADAKEEYDQAKREGKGSTSRACGYACILLAVIFSSIILALTILP
jgi:hypothetical protein